MEKILNHYNLQADTIEKLEGYGSINHRLATSSGNFVLKQYSKPQELALIQAEDKLMHEISAALDFEIPSSVLPIKINKDQSFSRLLNYIDGTLFATGQHSDALLFNFGKAIASLQKALNGKKSPAIEARKHEWDLQYCLLNRPKMAQIQKASDRKYVNYFFDLYEHHVLPKQDFLRHAIIHGDLNEHNVIVNKDEISGLIDFGDICYSPLINELAIALTYVMLLYQEDAISKAIVVLKGFHSVVPLLEEEVSLLYYLIPARLCVSVCQAAANVSEGRATEYILVNQLDAWRFIKNYISFNPLGITRQFLLALNLSYHKRDSTDLLKKRHSFFSSNLSLSYKEPIHMSGAAFQYMYDQDGNTYLDAYNNIPIVGHCHPKISQTISASSRKLNTNTRYLYDELTNYAEKLLSYFPPTLNKVFFVNSGSAATDLAFRIASTYNKSEDMVVLDSGYHGNTSKAIEMSAYKFEGKGGQGQSLNTITLPLPNQFKGKFSSSEAYISDAITRLENARKKGLKPAAFFAEPISGCGGQVPLAKGYLKGLKPYLDQHNILFISDEVQTGFARLGSHFWGFEMHEVIPDLVILGKPMGNSHPMGAVICTDKLVSSFANGMEFFSSFGGNPVSCAIGLAVLEIIEEEGLQQNALEVGQYFKDSLKALQSQFSCIANVRGEGLFLGFELLDTHGKPATKLASLLINKMKEHFVLLSTDGPFNNVIKTKPPLCFTKGNVDTVTELLKKILTDLSHKTINEK